MKKEMGFTLIELMITVAIIGILAAIAYPSYIQYVQRANRTDAQAIMMEYAQFMERSFATNNTYPTTLPGTTSPKGSTATTAKYSLTLPAAQLSATTYTIQAALANSNTDPLCGTLTLDQTGAQGNSAGTSADCWKN